MATVKTTQFTQQNANTIAGVQVDTAVYIGTGATNPIMQVGVTAPVYVLEGTQTAVVLNVVAGLINASRGDKMTLRAGTGTVFGTGIVRILNGSHAGAIVTQLSSGVGQHATVVFDGVAWKPA